MSPEHIAEIKERAFARIEMDSDYNRRVIELCEEVERLQKELAEAKTEIVNLAAKNYDLLASSQGQG